jgi:hypothetical protein
MLVDNVSLRISQVSFGVDPLAQTVSILPITQVLKNGRAHRIQLIVSLDRFDIKLGKREYFGNFIFEQMFFLENNLALLVYDVAELVHEVSFGVDAPAQVIRDITFFVHLVLDIALSVDVYPPDDIFDVKSFAVVVVKLWQIALDQLTLIKLFTFVIIYDVTILVNLVAAACNNSTIFIDVVSELVLVDLRIAILVVIEVTSNLVRIEVILLNVERSGKLTTFV